MFKIKPTEQLIRERGLKSGGKAQKYVDSEVIRCMDKFVPFRYGILKKSALLGTVIGSGIIKYTAPYARQNYYHNAGKGIQGMNSRFKGLRGRKWFERMKTIYLPRILDGAARVCGGNSRRK